MKKLVVLFMLLLFPINVFGFDLNEMLSPNIYLYDLNNNEVVYEKNSNEICDIASLTKILTVITALDNLSDINQKVTITSEIINSVEPGAARAGLEVGNEVTYLDLFYASILPSGADATNAIAYYIAGSIEEYAKMMNEEANKIGVINSNFVNPSGMDANNHYSTVYDIFLILKYALNNDIFRTVFTSNEYTLSNGLVVSGPTSKFNSQLNQFKGSILGVKTGYTKKAGYSAASLITNNGHNYILITTEGREVINRVGPNQIDAENVTIYINSNYHNNLIANTNEVIKTIKVENGSINEYEIKLTNDVYAYTQNEYDMSLIYIEYNGVEKIDSNIKYQDHLGTLKIYYDKKLIYEQEVILDQKINFIEKKDKDIDIITIIVIIFIILILLYKLLKYYYRYHKKQHINQEQLIYLEEHLKNNHGLIHAYIKGHKIPFKIIKIDRNKMIVTLKRLK